MLGRLQKDGLWLSYITGNVTKICNLGEETVMDFQQANFHLKMSRGTMREQKCGMLCNENGISNWAQYI